MGDVSELRAVTNYRCPECGGPLETATTGGSTRIGCGEHWYGMAGGGPDFVGDPEMRESTAQVVDSFSAQWAAWREFPPAYQELRKKWFLAKLGLENDEELRGFVESHPRILDAGTGLGYKLQLMGSASSVSAPSVTTPRVSALCGIDMSWSVLEAARNTAGFPNVSIARADIFRLPFPQGHFDAIICDGVLHHTGDARRAFAALAGHLAPGGEIFIHVYRKMGAVRELTDDLIRDAVTRLGNEEALELVKQFTRFGQSLAESGAEIDIPEDIPLLGIKQGRHNLQRFFYYVMFQCHWNPDLTFEQNNLINFDWYHPAHASRHTEEEVLSWFTECGLRDARVLHTNVKGVTAIGRR